MGSCKYCCSGKTLNITYSESEFVALGIQHTMRMRHIIFSSVACPALQNFSMLSHKRNDFRKNVIGHKMCFDFRKKIIGIKCVLIFGEKKFGHKCVLIFGKPYCT